MNNKKISLKEYIEKYTKILNNFSADELRAILTAMAQEVKSNSRAEFLEKLVPSIKIKIQPMQEDNNSTILERIESIKKRIFEKANEEPDWQYYDEDDSLACYEEFIEPLENYLMRLKLCSMMVIMTSQLKLTKNYFPYSM